MALVGLRRDRERRVPWAWVLYFFVAGVSYMCVEIGLIAKTELFLGSPLYAVAVILALFLASNGLGAYLQARLRVLRGPATLVLPAVAAIAWGVLATHLFKARLLSLPLPLKILGVALCVGPAGTLLGMFYVGEIRRAVFSAKMHEGATRFRRAFRDSQAPQRALSIGILSQLIAQPSAELHTVGVGPGPPTARVPLFRISLRQYRACR